MPKDFAKLAVHMPPELAALLAHPEQLDPVKIPAGGWLGGLEVGGWGLQWDGDVFQWIARHLSMGYTNIYMYMYMPSFSGMHIQVGRFFFGVCWTGKDLIL